MELRTIENLNPPIACDPDPDMALVEASKRGDGSAFEEVVRRYDRKLFRISNNVIHCPEDAQEIVQMALFKAYQNLSRFQGNAKFSTWLIRITLNESLMRLRKQRATREQSMDRDPHGAGSASASGNRLPVDVTDWAPNPEMLYSTVELRHILTRTLRKLRPTLRVVFALRDIDGHSIAETSEILNLTTTAVKTRLSRARMQLREELSQYFKKRD